KLLDGRKHGFERATRQSAVADLAARSRAEATDFAHGEVREVVVQEEATLDLAGFEVVHELLIFLRAERGGDDGLRLAAREEGRAVDTRQPADLYVNRSNLREASVVGPATIANNAITEDFLLQ